jgi:hypothetical protein
VPGREDDLPALHASIEGVARAKSELSPDSAGENNLPFAGDLSSHRKNILPYGPVDPNPRAIIGQRSRRPRNGKEEFEEAETTRSDSSIAVTLIENRHGGFKQSQFESMFNEDTGTRYRDLWNGTARSVASI